MVDKRDIWVDNVKVIACCLVVLGHFFQSMVKAEILPNNYFYNWFNQTISMFHVPLFFICSGYLYQKYSKVYNLQTWEKNIIKKLINLGVPYFIFSSLTWGLKFIFSSNVNTEVTTGLFESLFFNPISPYWYLYTLFFMFVITPTMKNKRDFFMICVISIMAKVIACFGISTSIYAITSLLINEIWFVIGMSLCFINIRKNMGGVLSILGLVLFIGVSFFTVGQINSWINFVLGLLACMSIIGVAYQYSHKTLLLSRYTMSIYLLHTIFTAPIRILMLKVGISNSLVHIIVGLTLSLIGPIVFQIIVSKIKYLNIVLEPNKYINIEGRCFSESINDQ